MNIGSNNPTALASSDASGHTEAAPTMLAGMQSVQGGQPAQMGPEAEGTLPTMPSSGPGPAAGPIPPPPYPVSSPAGMSNGGNPYAPSAAGEHFYAGTTDQSIAPPPPAQSLYQSTPVGTPSGQSYYNPPAPSVTTGVPPYAQKPKRNWGCIITSLVLLLLLVGGGIGAFALIRYFAQGTNPAAHQNTPGATSTTPASGNTPAAGGGGSGSTPTPAAGGSGGAPETLNLKITYSSIDLTITSVQWQTAFADDSGIQNGGVRVKFHEQNSTSGNVGFLYTDAMLLLLPDGTTTVRGYNASQDIGAAAGVSRDNWVDFRVQNQVDVSQLKLRIGQANENQMDVPLKPSADLTAYQPKTITPNSTFTYGGINWTLTQVTASLSYAGKQATTGNRYIAITLEAANNTSQDFDNFPSDYARLKAGGTTSPPENSTDFPVPVTAQSTKSGHIVFLMPQSATAFTLVMLALLNGNPHATQVTQDFTIQ